MVELLTINKKEKHPMKNITLLGIDIAKNVFQLHGVDNDGKALLKKRLTRNKFAEFIAKLPVCTIAMESCGGANYWTRKFMSFGHEVKLISPHFVTPFVKTNKSDHNDAEEICEAASRPSMRFVSHKTIEQQDIQSIHRLRALLIKERTALANQIRGTLMEYGIIIPKGIANISKKLPSILEDAENELSSLGREFLQDLYEHLTEKTEKIKKYDKKIETIFNTNEACKRIEKLEGIGKLTATAIFATIGNNINIFKNGRHLSAYLGLVPRQHSSGNKQRLQGISKRGDRYLRTLLIHGARSAVRSAKKKDDKKSKWIKSLIERKGNNVAVVALANKTARTIRALLINNSDYKVIV
jgi:transposase